MFSSGMIGLGDATKQNCGARAEALAPEF